MEYLSSFLAQARPGWPQADWSTWPFGHGWTDSWLFVGTKIVFVTLLFLFIIFIVRMLFGPGGLLREEWMDEEWERGREERLRELDERLAKGLLTRKQYERKRKRAERP